MKMRFFVPLFCAFLAISTLWSQAQDYSAIKINEVLANNSTNTFAELGDDLPDYIELINTSASPLNIGGMTLTDNPSTPRKYVIAANTIMQPGEKLIFYCDANTNGPGFHTGFAFRDTGEIAALYPPSSTTQPVDILSFGIQIPGASLGRVPDGTGNFQLNTPTPSASNQSIPLGDPFKLFINEWMALATSGTNVLDDWIELYNDDVLPVALGGLILADDGQPDLHRPIPPFSYIEPKGFVRLWASDPNNPDPDELDIKISSSNGDTIGLFFGGANLIHSVTFLGAVANRSRGLLPDGSTNIFYFEIGRDTPGDSNFAAITNVVINEVLAHTDPPQEDAIELYNVTGQPVDISHWWLSNAENDPKRYRIPAGTIIPAYGYVVFYEYQFNPSFTDIAPHFNLNSASGDEVYLNTGDANGNLTGYRRSVTFGPSQNGVSFGRFQVNSNDFDFIPLTQTTFGRDNATTLDQFRLGTGLTNAPARVGPIVINEIMYNPTPFALTNDNTIEEYIELYNITGTNVPLYLVGAETNTWRIRGAVEFNFPTNVTMAPGSYLLIVNFDPLTNSANLNAFRTKYSIPAGTPIYGPFYSGSATNPQPAQLSNGGEEIELKKPDWPEPTFVPYINVDQIDYDDDAPWPVIENAAGFGNGNSIQRITASAYGDNPANWRANPPTAGTSNVLDNDGDGIPDNWEVQNGFDPQNPADGALDTDSDGMTNVQEYIAGTQPRNAASLLKMIPGVRIGSRFEFGFLGVAGKTYTVQFRDSLSAPWARFRSNHAPTTTGTVIVQDLNPNTTLTGARFYRVITPAIP